LNLGKRYSGKWERGEKVGESLIYQRRGREGGHFSPKTASTREVEGGVQRKTINLLAKEKRKRDLIYTLKFSKERGE